MLILSARHLYASRLSYEHFSSRISVVLNQLFSKYQVSVQAMLFEFCNTLACWLRDYPVMESLSLFLDVSKIVAFLRCDLLAFYNFVPFC